MSEPMDRWKNRRKMAWLSLIAGLSYPLLMWISGDPNLVAIAPAFFVFVTGVVGAYTICATVDDKNFKDQQ